MSELFHSSGGLVVMHEEFSDRIFKESFKKVFFFLFRFSHLSESKTRSILFLSVWFLCILRKMWL